MLALGRVGSLPQAKAPDKAAWAAMAEFGRAVLYHHPGPAPRKSRRNGLLVFFPLSETRQTLV